MLLKTIGKVDFFQICDVQNTNNLSQTILHLMSGICSCVSLKYFNEFSVETSQFSTLRPSGDLLQSVF